MFFYIQQDQFLVDILFAGVFFMFGIWIHTALQEVDARFSMIKHRLEELERESLRSKTIKAIEVSQVSSEKKVK